MTTIIIYGDFNCPFSYLASVRADRLAAARGVTVDWRAVEHAPQIDPAGEPITGTMASDYAEELRRIRGLLTPDEKAVDLRVPPMRSNTALATRRFAALSGDDAHRFRDRVFTALWREGRNISGPDELGRLAAPDAEDPERAARWQREWLAFDQQVTPTLVLPDGEVVPGVDALARLVAG